MHVITILKKSNQKYSIEFNKELLNIKYIFNLFLKNKIGIIKNEDNILIGKISFSKNVKLLSNEESYEIMYKSKKYKIHGNKMCWNYCENNNIFKVKKEYSREYSYQLFYNNTKVGEAHYSYKLFNKKALISIKKDINEKSIFIFSLMFIIISTFKYLSSHTNDPFDSNF